MTQALVDTQPFLSPCNVPSPVLGARAHGRYYDSTLQIGQQQLRLGDMPSQQVAKLGFKSRSFWSRLLCPHCLNRPHLWRAAGRSELSPICALSPDPGVTPGVDDSESHPHWDDWLSPSCPTLDSHWVWVCFCYRFSVEQRLTLLESI